MSQKKMESKKRMAPRAPRPDLPDDDDDDDDLLLESVYLVPEESGGMPVWEQLEAAMSGDAPGTEGTPSTGGKRGGASTQTKGTSSARGKKGGPFDDGIESQSTVADIPMDGARAGLKGDSGAGVPGAGVPDDEEFEQTIQVSVLKQVRPHRARLAGKGRSTPRGTPTAAPVKAVARPEDGMAALERALAGQSAEVSGPSPGGATFDLPERAFGEERPLEDTDAQGHPPQTPPRRLPPDAPGMKPAEPQLTFPTGSPVPRIPPSGWTDGQTTLQEIRARLEAFVDERDWHRFHRPKDLAMAVSVEAGELLELYLWVDQGEPGERPSPSMDRIQDEVADVAICLLNLCNRLNLDLSKVIERKLGRNAHKYPAAEVRGSALKYDEYRKKGR